MSLSECPEAIVENSWVWRKLPLSRKRPRCYRCRFDTCPVVKKLDENGTFEIVSKSKTHVDSHKPLGHLFYLMPNKTFVVKDFLQNHSIDQACGHLLRLQKNDWTCITAGCGATAEKSEDGSFKYSTGHSEHEKILLWVNEEITQHGITLKRGFSEIGFEDNELSEYLNRMKIVVLPSSDAIPAQSDEKILAENDSQEIGKAGKPNCSDLISFNSPEVVGQKQSILQPEKELKVGAPSLPEVETKDSPLTSDALIDSPTSTHFEEDTSVSKFLFQTENSNGNLEDPFDYVEKKALQDANDPFEMALAAAAAANAAMDLNSGDFEGMMDAPFYTSHTGLSSDLAALKLTSSASSDGEELIDREKPSYDFPKKMLASFSEVLDTSVKEKLEVNSPLLKSVPEYDLSPAAHLREVPNIGLGSIEPQFEGFSMETCRSMVAMMDVDRSGKLGLEEFKILWMDVRNWRSVFKLYDKEKTGSLSTYELRQALNLAGYSLNNHVLKILMHRYGTKEGQISFDNFIACAICLRSMIDMFKERDPDNTNTAAFTLEEWVEKTVYS